MADMGIAHRRADILVAEEFLDFPQILSHLVGIEAHPLREKKLKKEIIDRLGRRVAKNQPLQVLGVSLLPQLSEDGLQGPGEVNILLSVLSGKRV